MSLIPVSGSHAGARGGSYGRIEASFELGGLIGNPFDSTENDVMVAFGRPDGGEARIPAFYDGGQTWRVRYTPESPGAYVIRRVTLNGAAAQAAALAPREFHVEGRPGPGFVRLDLRRKGRFRLDNGEPFWPLGCNAGWGSQAMDVPQFLHNMGAAGANWSRIWMCHWDGKNLDWVMGKKLQPGEFSLDVARKWDTIVETAEKQGIHFQMVLQHHGQYSTRVNPNWDDNPWNRANGGWLASPDDFFTDARAQALTRAKYRYIIARWGYSPSVMAWELFNEVQFTDSMRDHHGEAVAAWRRSMAAFLREQDPYHHLITTSSDEQPAGLWQPLDYYQSHAYPSDVLSSIAALDERGLETPYFIGETGPANGLDRDDGSFLRRALWGSMMSDSAGAAQYWAWDTVERNNLYGQFLAASRFLAASSLLHVRDARRTRVGVETVDRGSLRFSPGGGWSQAKRTEFTVLPSGEIPGLGSMPSYLHGAAHRALFPGASFHVDFPSPGAFEVMVGTSARAGAHLWILVDGVVAAEKEFPTAAQDVAANVAITAQVPEGPHIINLTNTGADWVTLKEIELAPYAPVLAVLAKASREYAALWVYATGASSAPASGASGMVSVPGMRDGAYRVVWWDIDRGARLAEERAAVSRGEPLRLTTPPVTHDVAGWVEKIR